MSDAVTAKVEQFFGQYKLRKYAKGQVLLLNGETLANVYHLVSGNVKSYDVTYRGDEVILNVFKPKAFFPMSLAVNGGINTYVYEADTDIEVHQAPVKDVIDFVMKNPDVLYDLLQRVYIGIDGVLGRMSHLMGSSAKSRLLYELILEGKRFGVMNTDGSCTLSISEKDLGARAGLSRETISREIHKLKKEALIRVDKETIYIKHMPTLEAKLGQEL